MNEQLRYVIGQEEVSSDTWLGKVLQSDYDPQYRMYTVLRGRLHKIRRLYKVGTIDITKFNTLVYKEVAAIRKKSPNSFHEMQQNLGLGWYDKKVILQAYLCGYVTIDMDGLVEVSELLGKHYER